MHNGDIEAEDSGKLSNENEQALTTVADVSTPTAGIGVRSIECEKEGVVCDTTSSHL